MTNRRIVVNQVKDFLDSKSIPYIHTAYSDAYPAEKTQRIKDELGKGHIESVLIEIIQPDNRVEIAMIIVPGTRKISLDSLREILNNPRIKFLGKQTKEMFPDYELGTLPPFASFYSPSAMQIYLAHEVLCLQEVDLYIQSYADCFRMSLQDFLLAGHPVENIIVATTAKYKIEVVEVFPETKRNEIKSYNHCMLGRSPENISFIPEKLASISEWISANFSECSVVIGDSIQRYTLEIDGMSPEDAINDALKIGRNIIARDAVMFNRHREQCKFNFVLCSELQKEDDYQFYHNSLLTLLENDENFKNSVGKFADMFLEHRPQQRFELIHYHRQLSTNYFLEEAACFAVLAKKGIHLFVYPGSLTVLQELCQGKFPEAPNELKNMVSVSLHQKRR